MIASVAISAAVYAMDKPYDYRLPEQEQILPGMRVMVPFGRGNRMLEAMVLALRPGDGEELKQIARRLDETPVMSEPMLHLAAFLRQRYFCTFYDAIKAILPAGLWFRVKDTYSLCPLPDDWRERVRRSELAADVIEALQEQGGSCGDDALQKRFADHQKLQNTLRYLLSKKYITAQTDLLRRVGDKTEKIAELAVSAEEALDYGASRRKSAPMQAAVLELLATVGAVCVKELLYFTGASMPTVNRLEKQGYLRLNQQPVLRRTQIRPTQDNTDYVLNDEQSAVYEGICRRMQQQTPGVALLYGVTGSGKTAVYVNLIRRCLQENKSAMLLVPEIALTPQLLSIFAACFGDKVAVLHSSLRVSERYDEWRRIRSGAARVILGTRSAVFAPAQALGLIILDEEQEHTYKSENAPRYHAREVAIYRGAKENALVLLGSATPSVESMYRARQGIYGLYTLKNRYNGKALPAVEIVDMKQELRDGNSSAVSGVLLDGIRQNMEHGQKAILLLNRRGGSPLTVCVDCGYVPECPRCSVNLTYHIANGRLMCHHCGYSQFYSRQCPQCGGHFKQVGVGTQRVQQELEELLPGTKILRMDSDTVSASNPHEKILSGFEKENIPVLIGTQMVAKGLNFPDVTLVGVLDADAALYMDNYRAAETAFSLITQVVGRAGRADKPGRAVIQTMTPQNEVIVRAAQQDYDGFYHTEIGLRRLRGCPPFRDLITIGFSGFPERQVMTCAANFRDRLRQMLARPEYEAGQTQLLGPAPAAITKVNNRYRYRLTLCCENSRPMRQLIAFLLRQFANDRQNRNITVFADVNAYD